MGYAKKQEQERSFTRTVKGFPTEIYFALHRLLKKTGVTITDVYVPSFFGQTCITHYQKLSKKGQVHTAVYGTMDLGKNPWGVDRISTDGNRTEAMLTFVSRSGWDLDKFVNDLQAEMVTESVFKGSSLSVGNNGVEFFEPSILKPIFTQSLEDAVNYSIYAPITFHKEMPGFRRGVLLSGTYGTGKSSVAAYTAQIATENDITFIYLKNPHMFKNAIQYFAGLGKVILFVEDIDRLFEGRRDSTVDTMLNTLDGVDSKSEDTMFIFTTNNLDVIERALLRPGRIDSVVEMELPNRTAAKDILTRYSLPYLLKGQTEVIDQLLDTLSETRYPPAVLREIVTRSVFTMKSDDRSHITQDDLIRAARSIETQVRLINTPAPRPENSFRSVMLEILKEYDHGNYEE